MFKTNILAHVVAIVTLAVATTPAFAQTAPAKENPARSVDVKKVFGYYDLYLRLPPQERDGFAMTYNLNGRGGTVPSQMNYRLGNVRTPIQIAPTGRILTMPDVNMYQRGKVEIAAGQPSASVTMNLEAIIPLARTIRVADASNPVNDYSAAVRRAGPLAMLAPKLTGITFRGVSSGEAVFADGRRVALTPSERGVVFKPGLPTLRGATSLVFPTQPTSAEFAQ